MLNTNFDVMSSFDAVTEIVDLNVCGLSASLYIFGMLHRSWIVFGNEISFVTSYSN